MTRRVLFFLAIALIPAALGACAAGGSGAASTQDRELLTLADFEGFEMMDAYSIIRRFRGHWLNTRSTTTMLDPNIGRNQENQIQVYIDGVLRLESVEALKVLSIGEVQEMRHMNSRDATMQYGIDHGAGAIIVTTR